MSHLYRGWLMVYVDSNYYKNVYGGSKIPDDVLDDYLKKASEKIDSLTYNRIVFITFNKLTPFQQEKVQNACCMCAEEKYSDDIGDSSNNEDITSYSVLDISVSVDNKNDKAAKIKKIYGVNEDTYDCLKQTGLMCGVI